MILSTAAVLVAEEAAPVPSPVVAADLFLPEPDNKLIQGPCTVSRLCPDGSKVTCSGAFSCGTGGTGWGVYALCDNVRYYCAGQP
jgi:hypothetical protein